MNETGFRQDRNRVKAKTEWAVLILRIFFLAMILGGIILLVWFWDQRSNQETPTANAGQEIKASSAKTVRVSWNGKDYEPRSDLEVTLLIGTDDYAEDAAEAQAQEEGFSQSDMVILIVADPVGKTYTVLHINRDTMCSVPILTDDTGAELGVKYPAQLAAAYAYGGPTESTRSRNVIRAVQSLIPEANIRHYVTLTMDCVAELNDMVGGVQVEVLQDIDETLVKGKTVRLKGDQALTYVRARGSLEDSSNLARMERQRQFLTAFQDQFRTSASKDTSFVLDSLLKINEYMSSDCSVQKLSDLVNTLMEFEMTEYRTIKGEAKAGDSFMEGMVFMEYWPDADDLQQIRYDLFYREIP